MYKEYLVRFHLDDEQEHKLSDMFSRWNKLYHKENDTIESFFEFIMTVSSKYTIDNKFETFDLLIKNQEQKGK